MKVCDRCGDQGPERGEWVDGSVHPGWSYKRVCWKCHVELGVLEERNQEPGTNETGKVK